MMTIGKRIHLPALQRHIEDELSSTVVKRMEKSKNSNSTRLIHIMYTMNETSRERRAAGGGRHELASQVLTLAAPCPPVLTRVMTSTRARERKRRNGRRFCRLQVLELAKIVRQRSHTQMKEEVAVEVVAVERVEKVIDLLAEKVNSGTMQLLAAVDLLNQKPNDGVLDNQGGMTYMMIHIMIRKLMRHREWTIPMPSGEAERRAERKVDAAAIEKMTISIVRLRRIHHLMCLPVDK
mmetsp:Transcript_13370/g.24188  ORF Transcript_13370/g.24188 Transcript_13370/m.24188 type:complete len:237 (-) Transcript_13370:684-1394(-)